VSGIDRYWVNTGQINKNFLLSYFGHYIKVDLYRVVAVYSGFGLDRFDCSHFNYRILGMVYRYFTIVIIQLNILINYYKLMLYKY
jgi:hypothetical protein